MPDISTGRQPPLAKGTATTGRVAPGVVSHVTPATQRDVTRPYFLREETPPAATPLSLPASPFAGGIPLDTTGGGRILGGGLGSLVRRDFPALDQRVNGRPLVWLDNAATTHKPQSVIDRVRRFYEKENSNIHRAAHTLASRATEAYEEARATVARFLGAGQSSQIVFVRGTTEGINLIAQSGGQRFVSEGDEIVLSELEHHSNIVPWQLLCERTGARIRVLPVDDDGNLRLEELERVLTDRTRFVAVTQVSNAIGTIVPLYAVIEAAHAHGALVVVDGAQSAAHLPVSVLELDADFFVFSGHKVFGPTGIGAVFGRQSLLETMPPWQGGGSMIDQVTMDRSTYAPVPNKFEAGTGHIAGAVGLAAALDYVDRLGRPAIALYEHELMDHMVATLETVPGLCFVGNPQARASSLSFVIEGLEPESVADHLDRDGIAVRAGHHCAQPILRRFGLTRTVRPSLALYNTPEDIDALGTSLRALVSS
jgi:cysteine desulfurase/selenocysteine lyase